MLNTAYHVSKVLASSASAYVQLSGVVTVCRSALERKLTRREAALAYVMIAVLGTGAACSGKAAYTSVKQIKNVIL